MGADYSFYVKTIETHARAFFAAIGRVIHHQAVLSETQAMERFNNHDQQQDTG